MRQATLICFILWTLATASMATVVSNAIVPAAMRGGDTPSAQQWADQITAVYSWVNANVVDPLNALTGKGDLYAYNGSILSKIAAGTTGQVLKADSALAVGSGFSTYTGAAPLTTKGDLLGYDGSTIQRVGVGTDGYVLAADSTALCGLAWIDTTNILAFPKGTVAAWSPAAVGTTTIPTGWLLADGTNGTPNLIGMFVIGTRPGGSSSSAAAGGFGVKSVDAVSGSKTHTHTMTWAGPITTGTNTPGPSYYAGTTYGVLGWHTHQFNPSASASASATLEPSDYALVYIVKQ